MLVVLGLIDVVMISNLLVMVIVGGYETFVSRLELEDHPDQPEWLSHVNAGVLKVKLAMAIIGISSIHLLRTFIESGSIGAEGAHVTAQGAMLQTIIHPCSSSRRSASRTWTASAATPIRARSTEPACGQAVRRSRSAPVWPRRLCQSATKSIGCSSTGGKPPSRVTSARMLRA